MIDLNTMRLPEADQHRDAVKTFLTPEARARVKAAAAYTGRPEYAIIEAAIMASISAIPAQGGGADE